MPKRKTDSTVKVTKSDGSVQFKPAKAFRRKPTEEEKRRRYLRSKAWHQKRFKRMRLDNFRCAACKRRRGDWDPRRKEWVPTKLEVHHLSEERFGHEAMEDLITLCQACRDTQYKWDKRRMERRAAR